MITVMRRYRKLLQVGLFVVIAAFVVTSVWVGARQGSGRPDVIASVNGEEIPGERFQRRYRLYYDFYAQMNRGGFTPELAEQMGLSRQVMDDLIREAVTIQRAGTEGLTVSDEEFNAEVHAIPDFQEGGRFSIGRYQAFLRSQGADAEEDLRRQFNVRKMQRIVAGAAKVSDAEVDDALRVRREEVRAAWALLEVAPLMTAATVTDEEAQAYLKANGVEFQQPERRRIQYVVLAPRDFRPIVTDADVQKYYAEHGKEFETTRQVHAAHVLALVPQTGGSEAEDKAHAKIVDVIKRARAGEDFGKLATAVSEDPGSKARAGDLGWVGKGEMAAQFEQALFALKPGEVSPEPVRTPYGFHAIKVLEAREASKKPLKEVAAQIRDRLAAETADRAARAKADEVKPPLQTAADFMAESRRLGLTAVETTLPRSAPGKRGGEALEETTFALARGGVSTPVKTPAGYIIVKAYETIPAGVPPFADIKDKVTAAVRRQKADRIALERARALASEARGGGDFAAAAKRGGATTGEPAQFSRARPAERLPGDVQLAALQTPPGQVPDPVKTPQGYYVVRVLERIAAKPADAAADRERLSREMLSQKQAAAWEAWVAAATAASKIERRVEPAPRRG